MDYVIEKATHLVDVRLYAANLISSEKWSEFFRSKGFNLQTVKLRWMDASFEDQQVTDLVRFCPNLTRLKLEHTWRIGIPSVKAISKLKNLEHLSLQFHEPIPNKDLVALIKSIGPNLRTLSLRDFPDLDDTILKAIHSYCRNLTKLRINSTAEVTDAGFAALFTNWANPSLHVVDLSATRDVDNQNPDGPEDEPIGLAAEGFTALMAHSGPKLRNLNISSCRHIPLQTLLDVFIDPDASFPRLETIDMSFVINIDAVALAGLFRAARVSLKRIELFGCFNVKADAEVPQGVVVVGAPTLELEEGHVELYGGTNMGWDGEELDKKRRNIEKELQAMIVA
jgi:DNA repair protein RAD7